MNEIARRLEAWDARGRRTFEDVAEYHEHFGVNRNFYGKRPRIQSTWRGLIRICLAAKGAIPERESIREFQKRTWARAEGEMCSTELFPLPKRSISAWDYHAWSKLSVLQSSKLYYAALRDVRVKKLKSEIEVYRPRVVLFYGAKYKSDWSLIAGGDLERDPNLPDQVIGARRTNQTRYVAIPHTTAHGLSDQFFDNVGRAVAGDIA